MFYVSPNAAAALAQAVNRRLPRLFDDFQRREPLLSRVTMTLAASSQIRVPVDLGMSASALATYDLALFCLGFRNPKKLAASLENGPYFDLVADVLADLFVKNYSDQLQAELYGERGPLGLVGLSRYAPFANFDEWIGGLPPETPGWRPNVLFLGSADAAATVDAVFDLSRACSDEWSERALIAAGADVAFDIVRGFQTQQRFWSICGDIPYLQVGSAEMFWAPEADRNAAFVLHPADFALYRMPPLVIASGCDLLMHVGQQLVCTRRRMIGRLQRYAGPHL